MLLLWSLVYLTILLFIIFILKYYWSRRHLIAAASQFNGPFALPFIGNALSFYCKNEDILYKVNDVIKSHKSPMRFWLGPELLIVLSNPNHAEKILTSSKFAYKHQLYKFVKIYLGEGLVSASGPIYKQHRRTIQPLFDLKFCNNQATTFQKHIAVCMTKLDSHVGKKLFNVHSIIHNCFVDIIGEIVMGTDLKAQSEVSNEFVKAATDMYDVGFTRLVKPWFHLDIIFNNSIYKLQQDKIVNILRGFTENVIINSWKRRKLSANYTNENKPIIDKIAEHIENNPGSFSGEDFVSHMITLYAAAEDTSTTIASFAILCFGLYPEFQQKAADEIRDVMGESFTEIRVEDLNKLTYLEMCIKDILRLIPIAPYIIRQPLEDFKLDKWLIPKGAAVVIPIFNLHRDPEFWENPEHFYPDHFLPETVLKRPIYSYVPFSAGPRGCIGKIFASMSIKMFLCNVLQKYEIEADGKLPDIKLRMDITVRSVNGYYLKLNKRIWK